MDEIRDPGFDWYGAISQSRGVVSRCPFASVHRCPRYYASVSLMGTAGNTAIDPETDARLLETWRTSDLWPVTDEQATSIMGATGRPSHFMKFCPEVAYDNFGVFASSVHTPRAC